MIDFIKREIIQNGIASVKDLTFEAIKNIIETLNKSSLQVVYVKTKSSQYLKRI